MTKIACESYIKRIMRKIAIVLALIFILFFIYPFFSGESIFSSIDKLSANSIFEPFFANISNSLKDILGYKNYQNLD